MSNKELEKTKPSPLYNSSQKHKPTFVKPPFNNTQDKDSSTGPVLVSGMYINYINLPSEKPLRTRFLVYISQKIKLLTKRLRFSV
jgi:hypothetical protein